MRVCVCVWIVCKCAYVSECICVYAFVCTFVGVWVYE